MVVGLVIRGWLERKLHDADYESCRCSGLDQHGAVEAHLQTTDFRGQVAFGDKLTFGQSLYDAFRLLFGKAA